MDPQHRAQALAVQAQREFESGRFEAAAKTLALAHQHAPADVPILVNWGMSLQRLGQLEQALKQLESACKLQPEFALAWSQRGDVLRALNQPEAAYEALQRACALAPRLATPLITLGLFLQHYGRATQAVECYHKALLLEPDNPNTWCNLAIALQDMGDINNALAANQWALNLEPEHVSAQSNRLMCLQYDPLATARQLRQAAALWGQRQNTLAAKKIPKSNGKVPRKRVGSRLRIGYVSGDFSEHPVGWFFLAVVQAHNKAAVEIFGYANQHRNDAMTQKIQAACDHWRPTLALTDDAMCQLVSDDQIDVLVDLSGHTSGNRLAVFARRCAPVQLSWLGYFASTGLATMDAAIFGADQVPPGAEAYFVEPLVRLAHCHFCYSPPDYAPPVRMRSSQVQPSSSNSNPSISKLVFGSFNNAAKLNDDVIRTWSQILARVPHSRLVLKSKPFIDPQFCSQMLQRFERWGCHPNRIELRGASAHGDMLHEYGDIDIALDPFPFSGALTTCEALWMGVPVVTLAWQRPVSRQSLAILSSLGLTQLVAFNANDYVQICQQLGENKEKLAQLRISLRQRMGQSDLMNGQQMAQSLEAVYADLVKADGLRVPDGASTGSTQSPAMR